MSGVGCRHGGSPFHALHRLVADPTRRRQLKARGLKLTVESVRRAADRPLAGRKRIGFCQGCSLTRRFAWTPYAQAASDMRMHLGSTDAHCLFLPALMSGIGTSKFCMAALIPCGILKQEAHATERVCGIRPSRPQAKPLNDPVRTAARWRSAAQERLSERSPCPPRMPDRARTDRASSSTMPERRPVKPGKRRSRATRP